MGNRFSKRSDIENYIDSIRRAEMQVQSHVSLFVARLYLEHMKKPSHCLSGITLDALERRSFEILRLEKVYEYSDVIRLALASLIEERNECIKETLWCIFDKRRDLDIHVLPIIQSYIR